MLSPGCSGKASRGGRRAWALARLPLLATTNRSLCSASPTRCKVRHQGRVERWRRRRFRLSRPRALHRSVMTRRRGLRASRVPAGTRMLYWWPGSWMDAPAGALAGYRCRGRARCRGLAGLAGAAAHGAGGGGGARAGGRGGLRHRHGRAAALGGSGAGASRRGCARCWSTTATGSPSARSWRISTTR